MRTARFRLNRRISRELAALGMLLIGLTATAYAQTPDWVPRAAETLGRLKIAPTREDVLPQLRSLDPNSESNRAIRELIAQLESEQRAQRETATQQLLDLPITPESCLEQSILSSQLGDRSPAAFVLANSQGIPQWQVTEAVFQAIRDTPIRGVAVEVLAALEHVDHARLRAMLGDVLLASAVEADADRLVALAQVDDLATKRIAICALAAIPSQEPRAEVRAALTGDNLELRLAAARGLAYRGERSVLAMLGQLLTCGNLEIESEAATLLQLIGGQQFGYARYAPAEKRQQASQQWLQWIEQKGPTATLAAAWPLGRETRGLVHVALPAEFRILVLDMQGREVEYLEDFDRPTDCERQPDGRWLFVSNTSHFLTEVTADGDQIARIFSTDKYNLRGPTRIHRLSNGNLLIPFIDSLTVVELDPAGQIVWKQKCNGWPISAERLPNGQTLVALRNTGQLVEFAPDGSIVWQSDGKAAFGPEGMKGKDPTCAQRLTNGNTLVSLIKANAVVEFDRAGQIVWEYKTLQAPNHCQRLDNGNTVISDKTGVLLIDYAGNPLWRRELNEPGHFSVY